jgi:streptomycin 6-kinase
MGRERVPADEHLVIDPAAARLTSAARAWGVTVDEWFETRSSVIAYGRRGSDHVVLKVVKEAGDEWRSGEIAAAFGGRAFVRVLEQSGGAVLLERARPGRGLFELSRSGRDEDATVILADVIAAMVPNAVPPWCPTVAEWGRGFTWYGETGDRSIPADLVARAAATHRELVASQRSTRLLHGDLQHYNVLEDRDRGWLAIDPKGVVGEVECEIAALLRNPAGSEEVFADPARVERRVSVLSSRLGLDADRVMQWAFALGVLSAIWHVEDGEVIDETTAPIAFVSAVRAVLGEGGK